VRGVGVCSGIGLANRTLLTSGLFGKMFYF
jgi:hypothetical protein